ncbi:MFS transporter [Corynebacterium sp. 320]|nr:MFS transporter [Corynebacterium sp. 320]KAB1553032.1 MFS transporter [Corynebacterium sp. 321]KAB1553747.1 MFS transporter [Corynebacterium sp. 319]KAB3528005.1 MFS transporter [Corynebacterium sp. 250]KAB3540507.1 MFS transporter [Corynebacterium sp. 366]
MVDMSTQRSFGLALLGLFLLAANLRMALTSVAPVVSDIQADLGLTGAQVSIVTSLPLLVFAIVSPLVPRLLVRWGIERTLIAGTGLLAVGLIVRSLPAAALLWVGTGFIGLAIATLNVTLPALVKRDFPDRIGFVTGTYAAVQAGFAAIAAGLAVPISHASGWGEAGWRLATSVWCVMALAAFAHLIIQGRRAGREAGVGTVPSSSFNPWKHPLAWAITGFMGFQSAMFYVIVAWMSSIEQSMGISAGAAGVHQAFMNIGSLVGSFSCSVLLSRLRGQRAIVVAIAVMMGVPLIILMHAPQIAGLLIFVEGIACGLAFALSLSLFALRSRKPETAAALSGMGQGMGYVIAASGPILLGAVHDATGQWTSGLWIMVAVSVLCLLCGLAAAKDTTVD